SNVENAVRDARSDVRSRVLSPLRAVLVRMRKEWRVLDAALAERQKGLLGSTAAPLSLRTIYLEIDSGLTAVQASLDEAIAADDALVLASKLAVVYEAGKALVHALTTIASNPFERLQEAVGTDIQRSLGEFRGEFQQLLP